MEVAGRVHRFDAGQGPIQKLPPWLFGLTAALLFLGSIIRAFHDMRVERDAAREALLAILEWAGRRDSVAP